VGATVPVAAGCEHNKGAGAMVAVVVAVADSPALSDTVSVTA
jgi:hypothetical protein